MSMGLSEQQGNFRCGKCLMCMYSCLCFDLCNWIVPDIFFSNTVRTT